MNFGSPGDVPAHERDSREHVAENVRRVLAAIGCDGRRLCQLHQVHGSRVHVVHAEHGADCFGTREQGDALVCAASAMCVGVRVADCGPVLLATRDGRVVAAVHAGWRGVVAGVLVESVRAMRGLAPREAIVAAIGPCLGAQASEMGEDVAATICEATRTWAGTDDGLVLAERSARGRPLVDLVCAMRLQLLAAGVREVDTSCHACTASDASRFFSHRREAGRTGRMLAVVGPAASLA